MERVYAIGDIHGSLRALSSLISKCEHEADGRPMKFVFIGDYIDRGSNSRGVIDYVMNLQSRLGANAICLLGNHEALALSAIDDELNAENWIWNGGDMTLRSYDASSVGELPAQHVAWFRSLRFSFDDGLRFYVHAGVNPARAFGPAGQARPPVDPRTVSFEPTRLRPAGRAWSYADRDPYA